MRHKIVFLLCFLPFQKMLAAKAKDGDLNNDGIKDKKCKDPNEVYLDCGSKCNKKSCDNWWIKQTCTDCQAGCYCKEDYVRNKGGKCVKVSECPKPDCKDPNKYFTDCGTACPKTCENFNTEIMCMALCVPGCFCNEGLVLDNAGNCIDPKSCPSKCGDTDREWRDCGSACPLSCDNLDGSIPCTKECVQGCFCKPGLVEDEHGNCVTPDCCPENECQDANREYSECGTACRLSCDNLYKQIACTRQCARGCFCKDGLVEDGFNNCVEPSTCPPPTCEDPNREWNYCGTACPENCENYKKTFMCTMQCVPACFCKEGLIEDGKGNCIEPEKCPAIKCGDYDKHYDECGTACPDTCENYDDTDRVCSEQCVKGCFCNKGLVLDKNKKCIKPSSCP